MRIEITEKNGKDLKMVDASLDEFIEDVEKQYKESLEKAVKSTKAKVMGFTGSIKNSMPEDITHIHFIENNIVILRNSLPFNRIAKSAGSYKKMERGLEGYLQAKGFDCEVKVTKDG
jgi:histidinol phosphatase-like PHP family hydrolase